MPQRWAIWLAVEGDLRFASHHEMMRVTERAVLRARVPVQYTQGYNPHPVLSLACPRPVGIATTCDVLVATLAEPPEPPHPAAMLQRLNEQAPPGLRFTDAHRLEPSQDLRPRSITYRLPLTSRQASAVSARLAALAGQERWTVERPSGRRGRTPRAIDLRPLLAELSCSDNTLTVTLTGGDGRWARPGEVLELLGLDERVDLAAMTRTALALGRDDPPLARTAPARP